MSKDMSFLRKDKQVKEVTEISKYSDRLIERFQMLTQEPGKDDFSPSRQANQIDPER